MDREVWLADCTNVSQQGKTKILRSKKGRDNGKGKSGKEGQEAGIREAAVEDSFAVETRQDCSADPHQVVF